MSRWKIQGKLKQVLPEEREKELISILLRSRGIKTKREEEQFFQPVDPLNLTLSEVGLDKREVQKGVRKIIKTIKKGEPIVIYGDYDADGISGTAILWETLYARKAKIFPYLPNRIEEGYGLSKKGIDAIYKEYQPKLIITVDNGVTASEAVEYAKKKGIEVIVSDHHVLPKDKPKPFALIHSTQISGSAVAWFFARELIFSLPRISFDQEKLSLVAIGTISDVLPLVGVNRSITTYGLKELRKTKRPGLRALCQKAGINPNSIDTYHVGFIIGPRINASGRIAHALDSLRLLCTKSYARAKELARILDLTNKERQKITEDTFQHARENIGKISEKEKSKLIFISHTSYNQGVIGLVAGKLVEEFYRPAVVVSEGITFSKASARSITGFDIISTIREMGGLLIDCGGHPMAAGFTVETVKIEKIRKRLTEVTQRKLTNDLLVKSMNVDCEVNLSDLSLNLFEELEKFKPYGLGNLEPVFATKNLKVLKAWLVGRDGKHLKLQVEDQSGNQISAIAFGKGEFYSQITKEKNIDIVYTLTINDWNGGKLELKIKNLVID